MNNQSGWLEKFSEIVDEDKSGKGDEMVDNNKIFKWKYNRERSSNVKVVLKAETVSEYIRSESGVEHDKIYSLIHPSGWTITAKISCNYYAWVEDFNATHSNMGKVWGNCGKIVYSNTEEGFKHFITNHTPRLFDMMDI